MPFSDIISVVVTPATSHDMTDLETIKDELGITTSASDSVLARYITSASAAIENYCNRVFAVQTVKDTFYPRRDRLIPLGPMVLQTRCAPIVALTAVVENGVTLVENTDFVVDYTVGQLIRLDGNGFPSHWREYPITAQYSQGFATLPADLQDAIIKAVSARFYTRQRDPSIKSETVVGIYSQTFNTQPAGSGSGVSNLPADVLGILDNYRPPVLD